MTASYRFGVLSEFNKDINKVPIYFFVDGNLLLWKNSQHHPKSWD